MSANKNDPKDAVKMTSGLDSQTQADLDALMRKYDRESNTRVWAGWQRWAVGAIMVIFSLYCIGMTLFYSGLPETRLAAFLAMIVFIGIYLGVVFLISGAAILSLKELSEAADSKEKYRILRRIGVDEKKIRHSLLAQSGVFFAMPLLLAIVHSVFGMQTAMFILTVFGRGGLLGSILLAAAIILVIYGFYFAITYICSRKIISE